MSQITWLPWFFVPVFLVWNGFFFSLLLLTFTPLLPTRVLQLPRQALEFRRPPPIRPPPLPDPFRCSWLLRVSYGVLAWVSLFLPPAHLPPCLLWYGLLGLHLWISCWRTLFSFPTPVTAMSDPRLLRKRNGHLWQDFTWRVRSFLLPFVWSISAATLPFSTFGVPSQLFFLLLGAEILLRSFSAIMCSFGWYMDFISNSSPRRELILAPDPLGRPSLHLQYPLASQDLCSTIVYPMLLWLTDHLGHALRQSVGYCLYLVCLSSGLSLSGFCSGTPLLLRCWFFLLCWGILSGRWWWIVVYFLSLPHRLVLFVKDLFQEETTGFLQDILPDESTTPSSFTQPDDGRLHSWLQSFGSAWSHPVECFDSSSWDDFCQDVPSLPISQSVLGRHSWRLRRHFRHVAKTVNLRLERWHLAPPTASSETSSIPTSPVPLPALDHFVNKFHPALAGLQMLTMDRIDRLRFRAISCPRSVAVDLASCRANLLAPSVDYFMFPAMMETVLNAVGGASAIPLIVDSGASCCISPCRADFGPDYSTSDVQITDLSSTNTVKGKGLLTWRVLDIHGKEVEIQLPGYHVPSASVRLLSPQCLLSVDSIGGGHATQDASRYRFHLNNGIVLDAPYGRANLPILPLSQGADREIGFWARCFAFSTTENNAWARCILDAANTNLSPAQKELLLWHHRLSHAGISTIHNLMRVRRTPPVRSSADLVPLCRGNLLPCKFKPPSSASENLLCAACEIAKAKRRRPLVRSVGGQPVELLSSLKAGHTNPGDCFSCDHYISPTPGRVVSHSGHSSTRHGFMGGTIWVDHASQWIFHSPQHSLNAADTIRGKLLLEREAADVGVTIKAIHTDNGVFNSALFRSHCKDRNQGLRFSGVGAHHQNGVAENAIRTISNMARANLIHASIRWPERSLIDLWPFAMSYAIWVHNRLPPHGYGGSPLELWSQVKSAHSDISRAHVFGCPVYVLDPALQDGKKIPKWDSRARQGIFVGFSAEHSSLVPLVFNPRTQRVSPQYHVIFDDAFSTVPSLYSVEERNTRFEDMFHTSRESFLDSGGADSVAPPLDTDWLSPSELAQRPNAAPPTPNLRPFDPMSLVPQQATPPVPEGAPARPISPPPVEPEGDTLPSPPPASLLHPDDLLPPTHDHPDNNPLLPASRYPRRVRSGTWKDGPALDRSHPLTKGRWITGFLSCLLTVPEFALSVSSTWSQPPPAVANVGSSTGPLYSSIRVRRSHLANLSVLQDDWSDLGVEVSTGISPAFTAYLQPDLSDDPLYNTVTDMQPHVLAAKASKSDPDNPSWSKAMNSTDADKWWDAMSTEMETLEMELRAWKLVRREPWMKVLPCTWAFRIKRFPDGLVKKFKARFCVRGDMQTEGVDFFETWSPVVQWSTVRTVMVLSTKLGLRTAQADVTAAFVHAALDPDEHIFVHQPPGFRRGNDLVLSLNRSVYGLRQAPRYFFQHLKRHMEKHGLQQSNLDPCLFVRKSVIALCYVDDILFYARTNDEIDSLISKLKRDGLMIRKEGSAEGFLGVDVKSLDSTSAPRLHLTQAGLAKRIVDALGLCSSFSTAISTPAEISPLPKDLSGVPASGTFNYAAVVGMLLYLCGHTRPDIAFAVHQCARYTFCPTRRHELALIRIGRYLKGTMDKGIIMSPSDTPCVDCYPDADFAGLYGHEDSQDPHCARSRTGYLITVFNCPVLWKSKLQTEIALSTMEAEYVALSTSCKDLFPIVDLIRELGAAVGLDISAVANMHIKIHEDNVGALTLASLEPRRMTPRSKHYAIKYHWFREHVHSRRVRLLKIDSRNQLGDLFTKGLPAPAFSHLRSLLMGW